MRSPNFVGSSGADVLNALIVGVEVECRIGNSVYPDHYDRGWHITGTTGVFGAAAAVGRLLKLDAQRMTWALGLAATQSSSLREMFGTMTKSFHPGRAAQNGATAAFLAEAGYDSSERAIEAPRGFANVLSTKQDYGEILDGLGSSWEAGAQQLQAVRLRHRHPSRRSTAASSSARSMRSRPSRSSPST